MRVTAAWRRWQEIVSLLVSHSIGMRTRGRVYGAYMRSAVLYGVETWALASRLMDVLCGPCDCKMLRYMAGVRWQDRRSSAQCGGRDVWT